MALIEHIVDLEPATSVQAKLNAAIDGVNEVALTATAAEPLLIGQPVYIRLDGQAALASRADALHATVAGIVEADTIAGDPARVRMTGTAPASGLIIGHTYYLGTTPGTLTDIAPTAAGQFLTRIGTAVKTDAVYLSIQPPILM